MLCEFVLLTFEFKSGETVFGGFGDSVLKVVKSTPSHACVIPFLLLFSALRDWLKI